MNKLIMKARSGVTLVELLVVILIVTILSVSMLPLLQPFVTESQYAAEAIPAIANMRTKIGVYVYDKGHLPFDSTKTDINVEEEVETWMVSTEGTTSDEYAPATYNLSDVAGGATKRTSPVTLSEIKKNDSDKKACHISNLLDIDYQDLKGNRSKPIHYQYFAISTNTSSYVVACFGNGEGLKKGTGYAVCELNFPVYGRKLIGTWKRYKSYNDEAGAIAFVHDDTPDPDVGKVLDCYIPDHTDVDATKITSADDVETLVTTMKNAGWEFN